MNSIPAIGEWQEILLRLGAAVLAGSAIGLNRDLRNKPAGLRTHALVSLGSALVVMASGQLAGTGSGGDTLRVVQGIITGIGFLGAGVILHPANDRGVLGLTTAASIWVVACLGIACGAGLWVLVALGTGVTLVVLILGGPFERFFHRTFRPTESGDRDAAEG